MSAQPPQGGFFDKRLFDVSLQEIKQSWRRCVSKYHLKKDLAFHPDHVKDSALREAQEAFYERLHPARHILKRLAHASQTHEYSIHLANADGLLLEGYVAGAANQQIAQQARLQPGAVWSEDKVGTNGVGTCLLKQAPLCLHSSQHFSQSPHDFYCIGTPILSAYGEIDGVLTVMMVDKQHPNEPHNALFFADRTAREIEATLFCHQYANYHLISLIKATMPEPSRSTAILAVNRRGWIVGASSAALRALAVKQAVSLVGQPLAAVVGYDLAQIRSASARSAAQLPFASPHHPAGIWFVSTVNQFVEAVHQQTIVRTPQNNDSPLTRIAGRDKQSLHNSQICHKILDKPINILLKGETGTGKEVWANAIHQSSSRKKAAFIAINCAAIPENLMESELFGYRAGAFTGGLKGGNSGKIEASHNGTLFLDEIGDMPLSLQAKLLRVLEEKTVTPLGTSKAIPINLHVICASHKDLPQLVATKQFRQDLYYRLCGMEITLTPLRARSDLSDLIDRLLADLSAQQPPNKNNNKELSISPAARKILMHYDYPGNIRQLKNILTLAASLCQYDTIQITDLPDEVFEKSQQHGADNANTLNSDKASDDKFNEEVNDEVIESAPLDEKARILATLKKHQWKKAPTASDLGISRTTLYRKMKQFALL